MTRIRTFIIQPFDGLAPLSRPFEETEVEDTLETWQSIVGGMIAWHPLGQRERADGFFLNDEGKLEGLPVNGIATYLANLHRVLLPGDWIAGTIALIGPPDNDGNNTQADLERWSKILDAIWEAHRRRLSKTGGTP